jgi:uncharacterized protein (DUF488 family)
VRSQPYSRFHPQFNRENLSSELRRVGIAYVFLGDELGARSKDPACYERGRVQYDRLAATALFQRGLDRVREGMRSHRLALMCAEKEPLDCHRTILIARRLAAAEVAVDHILADGAIESHGAAMDRLIGKLGLPAAGLFRTREDMVADAYRIQGERISYSLPPDKSPER